MRKKRFLKQAGSPLYMQVKEYLEANIDSHEWAESSRIPKEEELCAALGVSRITLREAMRLLVAEGRLERIPGNGTFVSRRKLEQRLDKFFSFTKWAVQNGIAPAARILRVETLRSSAHVAEHLGIGAGDRVTWIERLRLGDGEPLMAEEIWVPTGLCPSLNLKDLSNVPLNDILAREYGIVLTRGVEAIEPMVPLDRIRQLLNMGDKELVFSVELTTYKADGVVVYYCTSQYRSKRVKFVVNLGAS